MSREELLSAVRHWAGDRKPILLALGFLFGALAVLIIISVSRP